MKLKHAVLTLSLFTAVAIATSGCDRGANEIDFNGQKDISASVAPATDTPDSDTIVPQDTGTSTTGTTDTSGTTGTTNTGSAGTTSPYCPANTFSPTSTSTICCTDAALQSCFIVDPLPPSDGGVKGLHDHLPDDVVVVEPTNPTPPDSGVGGGGYQEPDAGCSHFQSPTGGRRMKQNVGTVTDADAISGKNDCVML